MLSFVSRIAGLFVRTALSYGVWGLGLGMFVESVGVPGASAVLDLTAGFLIATGRTNFWQALLISTAGLTAGSIVSYAIGYYGAEGIQLLRKKPRNKEEKTSKIRLFMKRYGTMSILFAQLFGTTRTWISIPAGAMRMDLKKFILYTAIGGTVYCGLVIGLSLIVTKFLKEAYKQLIRFVPIPFWSGLILSVVLGFLIYFLIIKRLKNNSKTTEQT